MSTISIRCLRPLGRMMLLALLCASAAACDSQPLVLLGQVPPPAAPPPDAGQPRAGSGPLQELGESFECQETDQVCGSDGKTYANFCQAVLAGVSVAKTGPC